ncbi:phospholipase D-like domain-containing protein [Pelagibacterium montanilacus]|uniref:phospholipase D-like domain-containing protein n=1 Tax=Pelagibacterium montanilacus TaxID=2185280 RepID=UPI000F8E5C01|nr:phospholipase D-like domain-containing protein [Pelagibacterium montanilacus]
MRDNSLLDACWRRSRADRLSLLVNGSDYFRAAKESMLLARHSIYLIGWDFDARIALEPAGPTVPGPEKIGKFLNWLASERPDLQIRLLKWDIGTIKSLGQGEIPLFFLDRMGPSNVCLRLDGAHPTMAAHHMKLVVIDDVTAFCGGIDMTAGRWDTSEHKEKDERRKSPWGRHLPPWHDVTTCISGPVVRDLADVARQRWLRATGENLDGNGYAEPVWPSSVPVQFRNVDIGIARTIGAYKDYPQVSEIERLTLSLIANAKASLYIENQYLASRKIAEAIAERLKEPDGPEIVIVMPDTADGWLEAKAMDSARSRLLSLLEKADHHNRFRAYYPVNEHGTPIYVHAKVLIADARYLKVGSANFNNRSMGFDTECDVVLDSLQAENPEDVETKILACRAHLLAEHLGATTKRVDAAIAECQSLVAAIEVLNTQGRLRKVEAEALSPEEEAIAESDLVDPEKPKNPWSTLFRRSA